MGKRWPKQERPEWKIRPARSTSREGHGGLSGAVIVDDHNRIGIARITFHDSLVEALGHKLSLGVSSEFPVHLRLSRLVPGAAWRVQAQYLPFKKMPAEDLWTVDELPAWAKGVYWYE